MGDRPLPLDGAGRRGKRLNVWFSFVLVGRALRQLPFFTQLSDDQVDELARLGRTISMPPGEIVCHEGERSDSMYVLLAGKVSVYRHDDAGTRVDLRQFEDGDYFGEVALLDSKPRTATVACQSECTLFVLDQAAFRDLLTANPSLVFSVLAAVADRAGATRRALPGRARQPDAGEPGRDRTPPFPRPDGRRRRP